MVSAGSSGGAVYGSPGANMLMAYESNLPVDDMRPAGLGGS